jgi:hypothetical protein
MVVGLTTLVVTVIVAVLVVLSDSRKPGDFPSKLDGYPRLTGVAPEAFQLLVSGYGATSATGAIYGSRSAGPPPVGGTEVQTLTFSLPTTQRGGSVQQLWALYSQDIIDTQPPGASSIVQSAYSYAGNSILCKAWGDLSVSRCIWLQQGSTGAAGELTLMQSASIKTALSATKEVIDSTGT